MAGNIILTAAYGADVKLENDPLVNLGENGLDILSLVSRPDAYLVDAIPILRYLPKWFPGAKFKRDAASYTECFRAMRDIPYNQVKDQLVFQFFYIDSSLI
jgi:hypothetical protein